MCIVIRLRKWLAVSKCIDISDNVLAEIRVTAPLHLEFLVNVHKIRNGSHLKVVHHVATREMDHVVVHILPALVLDMV